MVLLLLCDTADKVKIHHVQVGYSAIHRSRVVGAQKSTQLRGQSASLENGNCFLQLPELFSAMISLLSSSLQTDRLDFDPRSLFSLANAHVFL